MSGDDRQFKGGLGSFKGEAGRIVPMVIESEEMRPVKYISCRQAADPVGVYRITKGKQWIASIRAESVDAALKALPEIVDLIEAKYQAVTRKWRYDGEERDVQMIQRAAKELASKHGSTIRELAKTVGTDSFPTVARATTLAHGASAQKAFNAARRRIRKGAPLAEDPYVVRLYNQGRSRRDGGTMASHCWKYYFLGNFCEWKFEYLQMRNPVFTFWGWVQTSLVEAMEGLPVGPPASMTVKNFASECSLPGPK
ncbi:MAG: hypothetical protein ACQKBT_09110 [Puniceicoccales bacterium]